MTKTEHAVTLGEVLADLLHRGVLDQEGLTQITQYLAQAQGRQGKHEPYFIKALMALGAWVAAICFVSCLGVAGLIGNDGTLLFGWGCLFVVAATGLRHVSEHVFPVQLALALSCAGHAMAIGGAGEMAGFEYGLASAAIVSIVLCLGLYFLYPDNLHRFLSCLVAIGFLTAWIVDGRVWPLIHLEIAAMLILLGTVFVYHFETPILQPLGYAVAVSLLATLLLVLLPDSVWQPAWWPANLILAASLIWLIQWIAGGWGQLRSEPLLVTLSALLALTTFTTPGVLAALGLMVLGYARNDRYLLSLGIIFFPIFIVVFYYEWQISLLTKSWVMGGTGAALLLARWVLGLRGWSGEAI